MGVVVPSLQKLDALKEKIRDMIDPEEVLEYCGADNISHRYGEIRCTCPIHKGDGALNFSWDINKGVWTCWSRHCGEDSNLGRDAFALVQLCKKVSFPRAIREVGGLVGVDIEDVEVSKEVFDEMRIKRLVRRSINRSAEKNPLQDEELLKLYRCGEPNPYLESRGFSIEAIKEFEVGMAYEGEFTGRVVFPIRDIDGQLIGFGGRQATDDKYIIEKYGKYKMLADFSKGALYGLHKAKDVIDYSSLPVPGSLVIVEGFLDEIRAWQYGAGNFAASMGTALTKEQIGVIVQTTSTVVLAYDADIAGRKAMYRVYKDLRPYCDIYILSLPTGKDIADLSFDEFWGIYGSPAVKASTYFNQNKDG